MEQGFMPAWAEVSLSAIAQNYENIRARVGVPVLAAVKSDAYGHGAVTVARLLSDLGVRYLGVANIGEALELRAAGIAAPILILGYTPPSLFSTLRDYDLTQTLFSEELAQGYVHAAERDGQALKVHLKVDTGMSRLGFRWRGEETLARLAEVARTPGLEVEGLFTHLPASETPDDPLTLSQIETFDAICRGLVDRIGRKIELCHCANSGAVIHYPKASMDMVRTGLLLYGLNPDWKSESPFPLAPAMRLCATVSQVKTVAPGDTVSYGRTYTAPSPRTVAVVAIGYADGYPRILSNQASVLLRDRRAPIVGRVCMDMLMADVTDIPGVSAGDEVTLFGTTPEGLSLTADELADRAQTISYELLCGVGRRVPRVYLEEGRQVGLVNHLNTGN